MMMTKSLFLLLLTVTAALGLLANPVRAEFTKIASTTFSDSFCLENPSTTMLELDTCIDGTKYHCSTPDPSQYCISIVTFAEGDITCSEHPVTADGLVCDHCMQTTETTYGMFQRCNESGKQLFPIRLRLIGLQ